MIFTYVDPDLDGIKEQFEDDESFELTHEVAISYGNIVAQHLGLGLSVDKPTFYECFYQAKISCSFHGITGAANHIKQASHLAFWIAKLKPYRTRITAISALESTASKYLQLFVDNTDKKKLLSARSFNLNEALALMNADYWISTGYDDILRTLESAPNDQSKLKAEIEISNTRWERMEETLALSLREYNLNARGFATAMGTLCATGFE